MSRLSQGGSSTSGGSGSSASGPSTLFASGQYTASHNRVTAGTPTSNRMYFLPVWVHIALSITALNVLHEATTAGAGSVVRLGIYADNGNLPGALLIDAGTLATDTSPAFKSVALGIPQAVAAGTLIWVAFVAQTTSASPTFSVGTPTINVSSSDQTNGTKFQDSISSTLPANATPIAANVSSPPIVWIKAA